MLNEEVIKLNVDGKAVNDDDEASALAKSTTNSKSLPAALSTNSKQYNLDDAKAKKDGASQKLLEEKEAEALIVNKDSSEAKYIVGDHQNGDAKIEIDHSKQTFAGLTKEELMKYANDPFWVRLRWFIFILFWTLWFCMLAGAIAIVIMAPKCDPPAPRTWWERGPMLELDQSDYTADVQDAVSKFALFPEMELSGIYIDIGKDTFSVLQEVNQGSRLNLSYQENDGVFTAKKQKQRSEFFKNLVEIAKKSNARLIVDLVANFVNNNSEWFLKSEKKIAPFTDYFIWRPAKGVDQNDKQIPPNNWVSTFNESAWTYSDVRQEFYLHQFSAETPDLNYRNPAVMEEMDKVIKYWLNLGACGVRLLNGKHLIVSKTFENESIMERAPGSVHTDYNFYTHHRTTNQPELSSLLMRWRTIVKDGCPDVGHFAFKDPIDFSDVYYGPIGNNGSLEILLDLPETKLINPSTYSPQHIERWLQPMAGLWPALRYEDGLVDLKTEMHLFLLFLPGSPIFKAQQLTDVEEHNLKVNAVYKKFVSSRDLPSVTHGDLQPMLLANRTVVAYSRSKTGHPGYLVLLNTQSTDQEVSVEAYPHLNLPLTVYAYSSHYNTTYTGLDIGSKCDFKAIPVTKYSVLVLGYVPVNND